MQWQETMNKLILSAPRTLKVQDIGDRYRKTVIPQVRIQGKWLVGSGLQPNTHVRITNPYPGVLIIKSLEDQA